MKPKDKVTIKEAIELVDKAWGNDPEKTGRHVLGKQAFYNAIHAERIPRHGPRHMVQFYVCDVLAAFGPKKAN